MSELRSKGGKLGLFARSGWLKPETSRFHEELRAPCEARTSIILPSSLRISNSCVSHHPRHVASKSGLSALPHSTSQGMCIRLKLPHLLNTRLNHNQCDEGRPSCRRCVNRNEVCTGYRDEFSLLFRNENDKAARKSVRRRASTTSLSKSGTPSHTSRDSSSGVSPASRRTIDADDPSDLSTAQIAGLNLASPYRWAKNVPQASGPSAEDQAVSQFFEKYIMYPCNNGSSPGFLECLPFLFEEVKVEGRRALRWAVRAAAYANLSNAQDSSAIAKKALECYGLGLSALVESLADPGAVPDDYTLMTVVVLDLFEVSPIC